MEGKIKSLQEKVSEALRALDEFNAEFNKTYINKVKVAEASHINYTNLILASKAELEKLEKQKEEVINSTLKLVEDAKLKMNIEKDNFDRIMKQEQERLDAGYKKFDEAKKDYDLMEKETLQFNQEAKANNTKTKEDLGKIELLKKQLEDKTKVFDNLLSSLSQQKVQQDNDKNKIDSGLIENAKATEEIDKQQQQLVIAGNALMAKDKLLVDKETDLIRLTEELARKELNIEKLQENLRVEQENIDKQKEVITKDRSNLAAKEANLKQLEQELLDKKK